MRFLTRSASATLLAMLVTTLGTMPFWPLSTARAEDAVDMTSGLRIRLPDGWTRMKEREKGSRRIVASLSVSGGKYVLFTASIGSTKNYDPEAWVENEAKSLKSQLQDVGDLSLDEDKTIGGLESVGYTVSAKRDDKAIRVRSYMVKRDSGVFIFTETSFDGAESGIEGDGLFGAIAFQEEGEENHEAAPSGEPTPTEDTLGNYKLVAPAGWTQERAPPVDDKTNLRTAFARLDDAGNRLCVIDILRMEQRNAEILKRSPGELVELMIKSQVFSMYFGQNCESMLIQSMEIDEALGLGGSKKAGSYKISSRTMEQIAETRDAEKKKAKGIKDVTIPSFKPTVIRGRLAVISPYIYVVRARFHPEVANDKKLLAEYEKFIDSFEFLETGAKPPALVYQGKKYGDTFTPDTSKKARKEKFEFSQRGRKTYKLAIQVSLPPGFVLLRKGASGSRSFTIVAQDRRNRWFQMVVLHMSLRKVGEENKIPPDKKVRHASWRSNWESKARYTKVGKTKKFKIGGVKGEGFRKLTGEVDGWPATFTAIVGDSSGWRHIVEIETRGDFYETYEKQVKSLLKSLKIKPKK